MKDIKNIVILGDSIMKGVVFNNDTNRYETLDGSNINKVADRFDLTIKNISAFGLTAKRAYDRKMHLNSLVNENGNCDILLIELGSNDCDLDWAAISLSPETQHLPKLTPEEYFGTMCKIVEEVMNAGTIPVLMTPTPIIAEKFFNWFSKDKNPGSILIWLKNIQHIYMWQEYYSILVRDIAKKYNLLLCDVRRKFLIEQNLNEFMCEDGIHLNKKGHDLLTNSILDDLYKCDFSAYTKIFNNRNK